MIKDWNYSKNKFLPNHYTAFSGQKVWWLCQYCGHEWQCKINNRTINNHNCPSCTMKGTSFGEQAVFYYISKIFPDAINRYRDLGIELDIYIPTIKTAIEFDGIYWHGLTGSTIKEQKKYEICVKNRIKLIRIRDARSNTNENSCDFALCIKNLHQNSELENIIRLLLKELDPKSNIWTRSNPYQVWSSIDPIISIEKDKFEIIKNKYLREKDNSFIHKYPQIAKEWNYSRNKTSKPESFTKSSTIKIWWVCSQCKHEWQAKICDRTSGHNKCPVCNNLILIKGVNDIATLYPQILLEWDYEKIISYQTKQ